MSGISGIQSVAYAGLAAIDEGNSNQANSYTVQSGESFDSIAKDQNVDLPTLLALNSEAVPNPDMLYPGDKIQLPEAPGSQSAPTLLASSAGSRPPLEVYADPRELLGVDRIVLHETTRGFMEHDKPGIQDYAVKKTNVNTDDELRQNTDFVILQDGFIYQSNVHQERRGTGIGDGHGTVHEYKGDVKKGSIIDIEIDYRGQNQTKVQGLFQTKNINDNQYHSTARVVAECAALKYDAQVSASMRKEGNGEALLTVQSHRFADRDIQGAHEDPTNFDTKKFQAEVRSELARLGVPTTLVKYEGL
jgi:LysM repeat protein